MRWSRRLVGGRWLGLRLLKRLGIMWQRACLPRHRHGIAGWHHWLAGIALGVSLLGIPLRWVALGRHVSGRISRHALRRVTRRPLGWVSGRIALRRWGVARRIALRR